MLELDRRDFRLVTNWTHKDKIGRVIVPVGVSYNEGPDEIEKLPLDVAKEHPHIMTYPEPYIYFHGFSESSLDFELRAFIRDVSKSIIIRSEARKMIFRKLRDAGVEIPFPQRDVHIRSLPEAPPPAPVKETLPGDQSGRAVHHA